jgi:hypothetical protein
MGGRDPPMQLIFEMGGMAKPVKLENAAQFIALCANFAA